MRLLLLKGLSFFTAVALAATFAFAPLQAQGQPEQPGFKKHAFKKKAFMKKKGMGKRGKQGGQDGGGGGACKGWSKAAFRGNC